MKPYSKKNIREIKNARQKTKRYHLWYLLASAKAVPGKLAKYLQTADVSNTYSKKNVRERKNPYFLGLKYNHITWG